MQKQAYSVLLISYLIRLEHNPTFSFIANYSINQLKTLVKQTKTSKML